jgi:regulator of RNase E activity RraA
MAARFEQLPTPTVYDILDERGLGDVCCIAHGIKPLVPGTRRAGPAFTVRWVRDPRPVAEWRPATLRRIGDYFAPIEAGDIVVVDGAGDTSTGQWGEMLSTMSWRSGARGVVVDGGTRDTHGIKDLDGFEGFSRYSSPIESVGRLRMHEVDVPLSLLGALGRVIVTPGDWVVADDDAVLVIPGAMAPEVLEAAEALEEIELASRADLRAGMDINEVFKKYGRA